MTALMWPPPESLAHVSRCDRVRVGTILQEETYDVNVTRRNGGPECMVVPDVGPGADEARGDCQVSRRPHEHKYRSEIHPAVQQK